MQSGYMLRVFKPNHLVGQARNAVTVSVPKSGSQGPSPIFEQTEEGFQVGCIPKPNLWPCCSRLAIVFNAGSRFEVSPKDRGITHLIRRSVGLTTSGNSTVNLVRHFQQMGASVTCSTTRDHMIYTVDVAPNLVTRAGSLLAEIATSTSFYHWELSSTANRLMHKDIELLNRRMLPALAMELLHEAAFGLNPLGSGLGHSLFASADRVGSYSIDQIEEFYQHFFTPSRCALALVGVQNNKDGLAQLREIKSNLHVRSAIQPPEKVGTVHGFCGGEVRRDLAAASSCTANLAWPTAGLGAPEKVALDVAAALLTGVVGRIAYSASQSQTGLADKKHDNGSEAVAFHKAYDGHGLLGISVQGPSARSVEERLATVVPAIRSLKVTAEDLAKAKMLRKADILMNLEGTAAQATDMAVQLSRHGQTYQSPEDRVAAVDKVTVEQLNAVFAKLASSTKAAMSVVGPNAGEVLPLSVLLSQ